MKSGFASRKQPSDKLRRIAKGGRTPGTINGGRAKRTHARQSTAMGISDIRSSIQRSFRAIGDNNAGILIQLVELGNPKADADLLVAVLVDMLRTKLSRDVLINYSHETPIQPVAVKKSDRGKVFRYVQLLGDTLVVLQCEYPTVLTGFQETLDRSEVTESILGREHLMDAYLLAVIRGYLDSHRS